jgi:hypothetical protein
LIARSNAVAGGSDATIASPSDDLPNHEVEPLACNSIPVVRLADHFLSPLSINERHDPIGPTLNQAGFRCSDKGFLPMTRLDCLDLLDWTARQIAPGKRGSTPQSAPPILERLNMTPKAWIALAADFGKLFSKIASRPKAINETRSRVHQHRFHMRSRAREL